jgi:hypothetical protein
VRFMAFDTLVTGVRAFECAFNVRTSSFVHGMITRRADFAAFTVFTFFKVFFETLGIAHILQLTRPASSASGLISQERRIGRCGMIHTNTHKQLTLTAMKKT